MCHDAGGDVRSAAQNQGERVKPRRRDLIELDQQPVITSRQYSNIVLKHDAIIGKWDGWRLLGR
jgi:hypothetical protein